MSSRDHTLSQHFLKSPRLALKLIGHSNLKKRDLVVEIGAGSGVITTALAARVREVWAIEKDHHTAEKLRQNLQKYGITNVRVIEADFRSVSLPVEPYKVFANPPFHLSAEVFYKLLNLKNHNGQILSVEAPSSSQALQAHRAPKNSQALQTHGASQISPESQSPQIPQTSQSPQSAQSPINPPNSIYLILQKQLALKLIQTDRHYTSQLGHILNERYATKIKYPLKPQDFTPPPAVPTVLFEAKPFPTLQSPK